MPKFLPVFVWTLGVAALAFMAGRWTAPVESPSSPIVAGAMPMAVSGKPEPLSVTGQAPVVAAPVKSNTLAPRGYAADYQELQLLVALAATNPQLAMEKAAQFRGAIRIKAQTAILDVWGANDPAAAWNWVVSAQPDNNQQFIKLLETIGAHDPHAAVALAETFVAAHRELRKDAYTALLMGMTQGGAYTQALELVGRLEIEPDTKTELTNSVVSAWAAYEPQAALRWANAQPEAVRTAAMAPLNNSVADADPQTAVAFAAELGGSAGESMLLPAFQKWLATDAASAENWLASAPPNKDFDPIISELAIQPAASNGRVRSGLDWAGKIQDSELRLSTTASILSAFKQKDPHAAAAYLQELRYLSESERAQLKEDLAFNLAP